MCIQFDLKFVRVLLLALHGALVPFALTGCLGLAAGFPAKIGADGFSAGPVAEPEFPALVRSAVPTEEGGLLVFGRADWHGFEENPGAMRWTDPYFSGVVALSDADIYLLLWSEHESHYEVVGRVPYSSIRYKAGNPNASGSLEIDMNDSVLSVGADTVHPLGRTYLGFLNPSGTLIDREKNRQAHRLFQERVKHIEFDDSDSSADGAPIAQDIR